MPKFVFQLQNVLGLREKVEEQKKMDYGRALVELEEEKQKKIKLTMEREEKVNEFRSSVNQKIDSSEFSAYNDYIEWLKNKIKAQEKVIVMAETKAEKKRLELVEAMKERKMLDTLKEKAREEYLREEQIAEQKVVDEIVSYRYNIRTEQ